MYSHGNELTAILDTSGQLVADTTPGALDLRLRCVHPPYAILDLAPSLDIASTPSLKQPLSATPDPKRDNPQGLSVPHVLQPSAATIPVMLHRCIFLLPLPTWLAIAIAIWGIDKATSGAQIHPFYLFFIRPYGLILCNTMPRFQVKDICARKLERFPSKFLSHKLKHAPNVFSDT